MSKERLEELLELHEKAEVAYENCDFLEMRGHLETLFLEGFIDFLIKQAERVQELEEKHKEYVSFTESNNYNMDVEFEKLYKQNKRYREAIEEAFRELRYGDAFNAELILVEALEESE